MANPNAIEVCRAELFTKAVELREMYNRIIANHNGTDREFVAEVCYCLRQA